MKKVTTANLRKMEQTLPEGINLVGGEFTLAPIVDGAKVLRIQHTVRGCCRLSTFVPLNTREVETLDRVLAFLTGETTTMKTAEGLVLPILEAKLAMLVEEVPIEVKGGTLFEFVEEPGAAALELTAPIVDGELLELLEVFTSGELIQFEDFTVNLTQKCAKIQEKGWEPVYWFLPRSSAEARLLNERAGRPIFLLDGMEYELEMGALRAFVKASIFKITVKDNFVSAKLV